MIKGDCIAVGKFDLLNVGVSFLGGHQEVVSFAAAGEAMIRKLVQGNGRVPIGGYGLAAKVIISESNSEESDAARLDREACGVMLEACPGAIPGVGAWFPVRVFAAGNVGNDVLDQMLGLKTFHRECI